MPRKPMPISSEYPYHVYARSNNKENFYIPIEICWSIFIYHLKEISTRFKLQIHAFVLMNNHYHMVCTSYEKFPLPIVMEWFQRSINREINKKAERINHLFGGPYKGSLITHSNYFYNVIRYVYQNPVSANIVNKVEYYPFSTIQNGEIPLCWPITEISEGIPKEHKEFLSYLNKEIDLEVRAELTKGLNKGEFSYTSRLKRTEKFKTQF